MENLTFNNTTHDYSLSHEIEDLEYDSDPVLYCTILAILTTIGVTGNCLILVLFSTRRYSRQSYSVYVRSLAVSDSVVLTSTLTDDVISRLIDGDILYGNRDICFLVMNWTSFFQVLSSAFLLAIAVDRYIVVVYPLRRASLCTFRKSLWLTFVIGITCIILCLPTSIWNEIETTKYLNETADYRCPLSEEGVAFNLFESILFSVLVLLAPFCTVLVLNLRTVWAIRSNVRKQIELGGSKIKSGNQVKVTLSLIAVTVASVLVLLPLIVVESIELALNSESLHGVIDRAWDVCNVIQLVNYAQNFYIFLIFGKEYRLTLKKLFRLSRTNISSNIDLSVINSQSGGSTMNSRI